MNDTGAMLELLLANLPDTRHPEASPQVGNRLEELWSEARAAHPTIALSALATSCETPAARSAAAALA